MGDYRVFWLENSSGIKYSLIEDNHFLASPAGLGFSKNLTTVTLGNTNTVLSETYNLQSDMFTGYVQFFGDTNAERYRGYNDFTRFLMFTPLTLHYQTPNSDKAYHCTVAVSSLQKSETGQDSILSCPITLVKETLWYDDTENVIDVTNAIPDSKKYALDRPYHYGIVLTSNITVLNAGTSDTPMKIEIIGACENPMYYVYDRDDTLYGICRINGTYDYVCIDSDEANENIILKKNDAYIANAINYQDLTVGSPNQIFVTFIRLKAGTSTIVCKLDDDFSGHVKVTWRNSYATV